ncbi:glycosyltransferase [Candidatus Margulisiibacteriota bacterium]
MSIRKNIHNFKLALIHSHLIGRGGSQRYVLEIAHTLKKLGCDLDIYTFEYNKEKCYPELAQDLNIYSVTTISEKVAASKNNLILLEKIKLRIKTSFIYKLYVLLGIDYLRESRISDKEAQMLAKLILDNQQTKNIKYNLIFAHEEPVSIWSAIKVKQIQNIPIYWFCYETIEKWFLDWKDTGKHLSKIRSIVLTKLLFLKDKRRIRKYVDQIAVLDTNIRKKVESTYKITPLIRRGGINAELLQKTTKSSYLKNLYPPAANKTIILTVSRFVAYRRIHDILEMFQRFNNEQKSKVFIYINAPITDHNYYHKCMSDYNDLLTHPNIIIDTEYPASDTVLHNIYNSADIFIFPNEKQTWGHAPIEAIAGNAVAVISDGSGISEIFKDIAPTIYKKGNIEELTSIVSSLIENKSKRQNYLAKQKAYIKDNLTWKIICKEYLRDFKKLIYH